MRVKSIRFQRIGRGRDSGYPLPPAQTRACGATAHGSHLGSDAPTKPDRCVFLRGAPPRHYSAPVFSGTVSSTGPCLEISLARPLPSTSSATCLAVKLCSDASQVLWSGSTPRWRARPACAFGFPIRSTATPMDACEVSRFSRVQFLDVRMALGLRRAWRKLAMPFPPVWPSRGKHSVGARNSLFEARFLARRCLCLHFTRHLAAPSARLEVKMVRYSFLVGLFHPRLHAGLSRRFRLLARAAQKFQNVTEPRPRGSGALRRK